MNNELDFKINCLLSRGRNIVYYRSIDTRPRCQYIHVVRNFRKDIKELSLNLPNEEKYYGIKELFKRIILIIPAKVKSEECKIVIDKLAELILTEEELNSLSNLPISENQIYDE